MAIKDIITPDVWAEIADFPAYEVSTSGYVRRRVDSQTSKAGRILKPRAHRAGHLYVFLRRDGKTHTRQIHRLVAAAFVNRLPGEGSLVCHKDGNPKNNAPSNLYWGTAAQNSLDRIAHGNSLKGVPKPLWLIEKNSGDLHYSRRHPELVRRGVDATNAKLDEDKVLQIRALFAAGERKAVIARKFDVSFMTVTKIVRRETWKHI